MSDEQPTRVESAEHYDDWFDRPWGRHAWAVESRLLSDHLAPVEGARVLDVGCGTGRSSALVRRQGAHVVAVDPDLAMLTVAVTHGRADAALLAAGEALPFANDTFDAAVAATVLEFVDDPARVMAEMARVVRPSGRIVVGALEPRSLWGLRHRCSPRPGAWYGARFLSAGQLERLGRAHGTVKLERTLVVPGPLPGLSVWGSVAERLGRGLHLPGAFRVLTIRLD